MMPSKFHNRLYLVCLLCGLRLALASRGPGPGAIRTGEVWLEADGELWADGAPEICPSCGEEWQGFTADSGAEARRYAELLLLQRSGRIRELTPHPRYTILPAFEDRHGRHHQPVEYEGDFAYIEEGEQVVEDVKGGETAVWKLKEKMFLYSQPHLAPRVIPAEDVA